jgi:NNP family nitrate/nitrite transporter-like MFS transporter
VAIRKKRLAAPAGTGCAANPAGRNRWISGAALLLALAMWMVWSVLVVYLPGAGFNYSINQLFWLAALPGLSGATLRLFYAFMVPIFGRRKWTAISTAALLVPALGIGVAVQDTATGYPTMLVLALLCGVGSGNLAASGASGRAAGLGALGAALAQLLAPLAISAAIFGAAGGPARDWFEAGATRHTWLQNAGFIWVPFIVFGALLAWFGMRDPALATASFADQAVIFKRKHNWIMCWLCTGALGSFIGYAAGFPLLIKTEFPAVDPLAWAFLGPLAGVLAAAAGPGLADRLGAARVALGAFCLMAGAVLGVLRFLPHGADGGSFAGFFCGFMLLFAAAGVASAATARMIPRIFRAERLREAHGNGRRAQRQAVAEAGRESAAVLGFTAALGAYGAFFIPKSYGTSIVLTGSPESALWWFAGFYASCIAVTWWYYVQPRGPASMMQKTGSDPVSAVAEAENRV